MRYFECVFESEELRQIARDILSSIEEKNPRPEKLPAAKPLRPAVVALGGDVEEFRKELNSAGIQYEIVYDVDCPASTFGLLET